MTVRERDFFTLIILALLSSCQAKDEESRWLRGNLHTHTLWSDGDDFPESVARWYKEKNYDFLVFTDHNILLETPTSGPVRGSQILDNGELWQRLSKDHPAVKKYTGYFGDGWVDIRPDKDDFRASTERIWDIVLSMRLSSGNGNILYGVATDDTHSYHARGATPGRGWVMVRSNELETGSILDAIDRGDFYSTTGVTLNDISFDGNEITVDIKPEEGVTYTTEYIGTLSGFDTSNTPTLNGEGNEIANTTRTYSEEIGQVLAVSNDLRSSYTYTGNELYVRVRITSSADQVDRITGEVIGTQIAWVQPVIPGTAMISQNVNKTRPPIH